MTDFIHNSFMLSAIGTFISCSHYSQSYRLIKGDGEVLEEIVSRERHKQINQEATKGDGEYFQNKISERVKK